MNENQLETILAEEGAKPGRLIPILQRVQAELGYLPDESIRTIAGRLGLSTANVYAVASFYEFFSFKKKGRFVLKLCDGTTCHSRGAGELIEAVREKLGLTEENNTTEDGFISLETVSCLGACALAPSLELNRRIFTEQNLESITDLVEIIQIRQEYIDDEKD